MTNEPLSEEQLQLYLDYRHEYCSPVCGGNTAELIAEIRRLRDENGKWLETVKIQQDRISQLSDEHWHCPKVVQQKDSAYRERDSLVWLLAKIFPAWLGKHPEEDKNWDADWRTIVFIQLPTGQATWHVHDSEAGWFESHLNYGGEPWDGHSTEEKYERVNRVDAYRIKEELALGRAVEGLPAIQKQIKDLGGAYYEAEDKCVSIPARNCEYEMATLLCERETILEALQKAQEQSTKEATGDG